MVIKKVSILLPLFIFGIITQGWADFVKTMKQPANQITTIKMDENKVVLPPIPEQWSMVSNGINLLKTLEQKKNFPLVDLLSQVIFYPSSQNDWRDNILNFKKVAEIKSSNPDFDPSGFGRHPWQAGGVEERPLRQCAAGCDHCD